MRNPANKAVVEKLKPNIENILEEIGLELFEITFRSERGGKVLRITVDSEKGAGIEDCTNASKAISGYLDEMESLIPADSYQLEVSTPGLERPLRNENDFKRFIGRKCKIKTSTKDESGRQNYTGRIESVEEGVVNIHVEKESKIFKISIENISKANLEVEF
jgi:ribosome maturation factor RimP